MHGPLNVKIVVLIFAGFTRKTRMKTRVFSFFLRPLSNHIHVLTETFTKRKKSIDEVKWTEAPHRNQSDTIQEQ